MDDENDPFAALALSSRSPSPSSSPRDTSKTIPQPHDSPNGQDDERDNPSERQKKRTDLSPASFARIKATYVAKREEGNSYLAIPSLLRSLGEQDESHDANEDPTTSGSASKEGEDVRENGAVNGNITKKPLPPPKKVLEIITHALDELYFKGEYALAISTVDSVLEASSTPIAGAEGQEDASSRTISPRKEWRLPDAHRAVLLRYRERCIQRMKKMGQIG